VATSRRATEYRSNPPPVGSAEQRRRAIEDVERDISIRETQAEVLQGYIASPPTPPDWAAAGIDIEGDNISFARDLPLVQRALPRVRPGVAARAEETRRELGSRLSRAVDKPQFSLLHRLIVALLLGSGIILILVGSAPTILTWVLGRSNQESSSSSLPTPPPPPTATAAPPPSPTPAHGGRAAPQSLTIPAVGSGAGASWTILPVLTEQWRTLSATDTALFPLAGGELRQMGAYPGEADNLILFGAWPGFGDQLQNLQLNDWLIVTDRSSVQYLYIIVPCDPANQRKECIADKRDLTQLGVTASPTLTLVASRDGATNYILRAVGGSKVSH